MRTYELSFIIDAQLAPEKQEETITKFLELMKSLDVEIINMEKWGKKKLAYQIDDHQYGHYLMTQFKTEPDVIPQIERHLKLSPNIFRYLILYRDPRTLKLLEQQAQRIARQATMPAAESSRPTSGKQGNKVNDGKKDAAADVSPEADKPVEAAAADVQEGASEKPAEKSNTANGGKKDADVSPEADKSVEVTGSDDQEGASEKPAEKSNTDNGGKKDVDVSPEADKSVEVTGSDDQEGASEKPAEKSNTVNGGKKDADVSPEADKSVEVTGSDDQEGASEKPAEKE